MNAHRFDVIGHRGVRRNHLLQNGQGGIKPIQTAHIPQMGIKEVGEDLAGPVAAFDEFPSVDGRNMTVTTGQCNRPLLKMAQLSPRPSMAAIR